MFLFVFACVCVNVCVMSNHSPAKTTCVDLSKLDALLHKTHIKVLLLQMYQGSTCACSIISLSKKAHQMCWDHPFSQRNKTTERAVGVGVGGDREGWTKFVKKRVRWALQGVRTPLPTMFFCLFIEILLLWNQNSFESISYVTDAIPSSNMCEA